MTRYESHDDIVSDVQRYFASKIFELEGIGMSLENVMIDPGSGVVAIIASLSAMMIMASSESIDTANANAILSNLQSMKVSAYEMYMTVPEVAALDAITGNTQEVTLTGETTATTVEKILAGRMGRKALIATDAYSIVGDGEHWYVIYELQGTDSPLVKQLLADTIHFLSL